MPSISIPNSFNIAGQHTRVTQGSSATTAVTANTRTGVITTYLQNVAAGVEVSFVVNNSTVNAGDVVVVCIGGGVTLGTPLATVNTVTQGAFTVTITNLAGSDAFTGNAEVNFVVIKAAV